MRAIVVVSCLLAIVIGGAYAPAPFSRRSLGRGAALSSGAVVAKQAVAAEYEEAEASSESYDYSSSESSSSSSSYSAEEESAELEESEIAEADVVGGVSEVYGGGYGGASSYGAAGYGASKSAAAYAAKSSQAVQQQSSYSSSSSTASRSSSSQSKSASAASAYQYQESWPVLYRQPLFQNLCEIESTYKSTELVSSISQKESYDYYSAFDSLYNSNAIFKSYISAATGVSVKTYEEKQKFTSLIRQQPGPFLRIVQIFAKNPTLFQSPIGKFLISGTSTEVLKTYSKTVSSYEAFSQSNFIDGLIKSKYYSRTLGSYFKLANYDEATLRSKVFSVYKQNPAGTLLLLRHVLTRRTLSPFSVYKGFKVSSNVASQYSRAFKKSYKHNTYYTSYSKVSKSSSSSSSSSSSYKSAAAAASAVSAVSGSRQQAVVC